MSSRAKLLVSVLFIAVILLCIGLTRFYFDVTKNTGENGQSDKIADIVRDYGDKRVFRSTTGYCGVINDAGAVLIEPEWMEVLDVTDSMVVVSRRMHEDVLIGGIDYEENVQLPFVFRTMESLGGRYFAGTVDEDETILIYDSAFRLAFPRSYEAVALEGDLLSLTADGRCFSYDISGEVPRLQRADMLCSVCGCPLAWRVSNQTILRDVSEDDLVRIDRSVTAYMDMLQQSEFDALPDISGSDYIGALTKPGSFTDMQFDSVGGFSFSPAPGAGEYDLQFTAAYHLTTEEQEADTAPAVQVQLHFRRNAEMKMILTAANLNFQGTGLGTQKETEAEA